MVDAERVTVFRDRTRLSSYQWDGYGMRPNISGRAYRTVHSGLAKRFKCEEDPHLLTPHPPSSPHSRINGARFSFIFHLAVCALASLLI